MGNTPLGCASGGGGGGGGGGAGGGGAGGAGGAGGEVRKVRVLLPHGNIELLDGPVEAAELMIEYINHMVMHCSAVRSGVKGERTNMTILQPHEILQPGQAYVVHPIPSPLSNKKTKLRPQQISVPNLNTSGEDVAQQAARLQQNQETATPTETPFKQDKSRFFLQRYQRKVADSSQSENAPRSTAGGALRRLFVEEATELPIDRKDHAMDKSNDARDSVLLNLKMYMGWRPALESIPESPRGYHPPNLNMRQQPPLLCVS